MPRDNRYLALPYADCFAAVEPMLPGHDLPWLRELRAHAIDRFRQSGLPTNRDERWKYTSLGALAAANFRPGAVSGYGSVPSHLPRIVGEAVVVFVNGRHRPDLSSPDLPAGIEIQSLADTIRRDPEAVRDMLGNGGEHADALDSLNVALAADGWVVRIAEGASVSVPVEIVHVMAPGNHMLACHLRNAVVAEPGSNAVLIETYLGETNSTCWVQSVSGIIVKAGARLRHYKDQAEDLRSFHTAAAKVCVEQGAQYEAFLLSTGAALSRNEATVLLDGPGARCRLDSAYLARGRQHLDNTTEIIHAKPNTTSVEVYKGALDEQARGVFQGRIVVQKDAQKSDGRQLNKTILLSDRAEIDTKPELEIFADDVKCSHGATAGELDDDALFYLRARGIDQIDARRMLVEAFIEDTLENIAEPVVREAFIRRIGDWMDAAMRQEAAA